MLKRIFVLFLCFIDEFSSWKTSVLISDYVLNRAFMCDVWSRLVTMLRHMSRKSVTRYSSVDSGHGAMASLLIRLFFSIPRPQHVLVSFEHGTIKPSTIQQNRTAVNCKCFSRILQNKYMSGFGKARLIILMCFSLRGPHTFCQRNVARPELMQPSQMDYTAIPLIPGWLMCSLYWVWPQFKYKPEGKKRQFSNASRGKQNKVLFSILQCTALELKVTIDRLAKPFYTSRELLNLNLALNWKHTNINTAQSLKSLPGVSFLASRKPLINCASPKSAFQNSFQKWSQHDSLGVR